MPPDAVTPKRKEPPKGGLISFRIDPPEPQKRPKTAEVRQGAPQSPFPSPPSHIPVD